MDDLVQAMARFQDCVERRDAAVAAEILDDDFALALVQPATALMPRARWLEVLPDYVVHSYSSGEPMLDVEGDLAVALHLDEMDATVLGEPRQGKFVITDVWRRRGTEWKLWRRHSTPLTAAVLPGA